MEAFGKLILDWLLAKLAGFFEMLGRNAARSADDHKTAESEAAADTAKLAELKPDATAEETDAAIDDASKHF